jgi:hypothetical protein
VVQHDRDGRHAGAPQQAEHARVRARQVACVCQQSMNEC